MPYLIFPDFKKQIQVDNLMAIIGQDLGVLETADLEAVEEVQGYLIQKYDIEREFAPLLPYDPTNANYKALDKVYLDAPAYNANAAYNEGVLSLQSGNVYISNQSITSPAGAFDASKWDLIGPQYQFFYGKLPFPEFNYKMGYKKGAQVWYKDATYTAQASTFQMGHDELIQYRVYENVPFGSVFPDNPKAGAKFWGSPSPYSIAMGSIANPAMWTKGDKRTQSIVMIVIDVALFHLHSRIAPRNIPELRVTRYENAIRMLKGFANGDTTAALPVLQPKSGSRIRFGGAIKNINSY